MIERAPETIEQTEASDSRETNPSPEPIVPPQPAGARAEEESHAETTDPVPLAPQPYSPSGIIQKGPTPQLIEVRFKGKRRDFYAAHLVPPLRPREYVVVEADRGQDLGLVTAIGELAKRKCDACEGCGPKGLPSQRVLRRAAPVDVERAIDLRGQEGPIRSEVRQMVNEHRLKMKISDAEWQWDRNKLIIYFTAEKRVDFRVLVR
ncbi:MAG: PSP1 domain-containing protein, partial [Gemmatimonadales bacterium]